jgi:hypothetical protein
MLLKAGQEALKNWRMNARDSHLRSLSAKESEEQAISYALDEMEKAIQENADAVHDKDASWSWAMNALLVDHTQYTGVDGRTAMRKEIREETRKANPLLTREELKPHIDRAMLRPAL